MAGRALELRPWRVRPLVGKNNVSVPNSGRPGSRAPAVAGQATRVPQHHIQVRGQRVRLSLSVRDQRSPGQCQHHVGAGRWWACRSPGHGTCPHQISSHSHVSVCPRHSDRSSHMHVLFYLLTASSVYSALLRFSPDVFLPSPRGARYILPMTWAIWRLVISSTKRQISLRSCACATSAS